MSLICLDLSRLYFAARSLSVVLNYEALLDHLESLVDGEDVVDVIGFTVADPGNPKQTKFLERLRDLDVDVRTYPVGSEPSFTPEITAEVAKYEGHRAIVVSNDDAFLRVHELLQQDGKQVRMCFFSDRIDSSWNPRLIRGDIQFIDLSDPEVRKVITR